jgi:dTDP-4-dehydrorhamnose 3,5-epimerase
MIRVTPTRLPEVLLVEPRVLADERGYFTESWNQLTFAQATGVTSVFVQDNHSHSRHGVLRGLHYQVLHPQGKLVRVVRGRVFDVAVDMRQCSPRLGHWFGTELSDMNQRQLWVPPGFAHGFLVLSESADVLYKTTDVYAPRHERVLRWDDPHVAVAWPLHELKTAAMLSDKDHAGSKWPHAPLVPATPQQ